MNQQERSHPISPLSWIWPINLATYDRTPALTAAERTELIRKMARPHFQIKKETRTALQRLLQPIDDVCEYAHIDHEVHNGNRPMHAHRNAPPTNCLLGVEYCRSGAKA